MGIFKWVLNKILPEDKEGGCGYLRFKLPLNHPFTAQCDLHDEEFGKAHEGKEHKTLDEADWDLFFGWVQIAAAETDPKMKIRRALEICEYFPLGRMVGGYLWDGNKSKGIKK